MSSEGGVHRRRPPILRTLYVWFVVFGGKYALLPYIAAIWAFGTYDSEIATPWTIGWLMLWMAFGPVAAIVGVWLLVTERVLSIASIVALIIAVPFYPQALTVLVTLFFAFFITAPWVWIPLAVLIATVAVVVYWYTGGIGL